MNFREQNVLNQYCDPYLQSWFHSSWTVVTRNSSELLEDILLFDACFKNWTYLLYDNDSSFSSVSVCFQCSVSVQEFHLVWKCCILKTITTMKKQQQQQQQHTAGNYSRDVWYFKNKNLYFDENEYSIFKMKYFEKGPLIFFFSGWLSNKVCKVTKLFLCFDESFCFFIIFWMCFLFMFVLFISQVNLKRGVNCARKMIGCRLSAVTLRRDVGSAVIVRTRRNWCCLQALPQDSDFGRSGENLSMPKNSPLFRAT